MGNLVMLIEFHIFVGIWEFYSQTEDKMLTCWLNFDSQ